ncbi:hypothetical protein GOP56_12555 [Brevibacillus sp. 7WMA2]|uniref:Uncharacterized protein n=1 Tax=Brevibacillus laterosporus LMG 15441 TaxID=1042163 RepID=A0A075RA66_BRELA|nr:MULTISPECIES: hypothetical protein [Brevibacillus]AIG28266.1 hypothetical protein BRLA_c039830 [Brevibacillus laterosporus LMG 15441]AUM66637.1 hypothetical protein C0R09_20115 [Brevibacillus laterosporus]AYK05505.1 hypothetical protein D8Z77_03255 [Brevibacillus laterosporus]ERM17172.1 membrane protein [Brevibacillus laterosporus PE36]MBA4533686.1 hypothetical protein [Brevibacillus halotolerans]
MKNSRSERHRMRRRADRDVSRFWIMGFIFSLIVLTVEFFVTIPAEATWLLEMEMILFSASFTLLAFYLLGLTFVFSKQGEAGGVNHQVIIYVWLGAILYHLFVLVTNITNQHVYKAGIILFLGPLFLTIYHFITYLSALLQARREEEQTSVAALERTAYQLISEATKLYEEIRRLKTEFPEVEQMLNANQFAHKLEKYTLEMQQYLQVDSFQRRDLEFLEGHYLFIENILIIVKQHPGISESRKYLARERVL